MMEARYRDTLQRVLIERCQRNPKYSLRAFARDLRLSPARLSDVLNGKRGLSRESALPITQTLGMTPLEAEIFCDQVEAMHARNRSDRNAAIARLKKRAREQNTSLQELSVDAFHVVSDWHHFALTRLLQLPKAKSDTKWLANALGLQEAQVIDALERMARLGMINRQPNGRYKLAADSVFSPDGVPSEAIRKFHEQILHKAIASIHLHPVAERDLSNMMIPFDPRDMDLVREKIRNLGRELVNEFSGRATATTIYNLSVQFFSLTPSLTAQAAQPQELDS